MSDLEIVCCLLFTVIVLLVGFIRWLVVKADEIDSVKYWEEIAEGCDKRETAIAVTEQDSTLKILRLEINSLKERQEEVSGFLCRLRESGKILIPREHKGVGLKEVKVDDAVVALFEYLGLSYRRVERQSVPFELIKPKKK